MKDYPDIAAIEADYEIAKHEAEQAAFAEDRARLALRDATETRRAAYDRVAELRSKLDQAKR